MSVKELHEKRVKMWDSSIQNHEKYIDVSTGLFADKYIEYRKCPVCNGDNEQFMFHKEGGVYVKCQSCSMAYLNPVLTDQALTDYYQINHTVQSEVVESDTDSFYVGLYKKGLETILGHNKNCNQILDIGCSSGVFLDVALEKRLSTSGIELNTAEAVISSSKGHNVYNATVEMIEFNNRFDAITLWDVFEHIKDGFGFLKQIVKLLNEKGVIFLQIPSSDALAARTLKSKCNMFDGLEHVNLYGLSTIQKLIEKVGLEIKSVESVISEIGVMNNYLNYKDPYFGETYNRSNILGLVDERQLLSSLQGYKLQILLGVA